MIFRVWQTLRYKIINFENYLTWIDDRKVKIQFFQPE